LIPHPTPLVFKNRLKICLYHRWFQRIRRF
jgi:hypothetical protein